MVFLPKIEGKEPFDEVVVNLAKAFVSIVHKPLTFEEFCHGELLTELVQYLHNQVHHQFIIHAILALKGHFEALETDDDQGISVARGLACEAAALRFLVLLSDREKIDLLLQELPCGDQSDAEQSNESGNGASAFTANEQSALLSCYRSPQRGVHIGYSHSNDDQSTSNLATHFEGLNALEIAAVSGAKRFLSQRPVQRIVNAIWKGDIIFWSNLGSKATKRAQIYKGNSTDPYSRLRVPVYLKVFEILFFIAFLAFYYAVLVQRSFHAVTTVEVLLYIWIVSFAYNELGEFWDAGTTLYLSDFWSAWDIVIVLIGVAFFIARVIGLGRGNDAVLDTAFDILSLEALFLVPRICSLLSIHPYFGTLIPCLSAMTVEFIKFLSIVIVLYSGFLTTFCLLARGYFTFREMSLILTKVFFGSSYLGFDIAEKISPYLGLPLMLIFVVLTNILLVTSLISILSNSLTKVIEHARDEYLFVYSIYVLEASTSNRLTYFLPPLNLIPLALRPLRLFLSADRLRTTRIILLKMTHLPHIFAIGIYETFCQSIGRPRSSDLVLGSPKSVERPAAWRKSAMGNRTSNIYPLLAAIGKSDSSFASGQAQSYENDADVDPQEDIRQILSHLRAQVDHLTDLLQQQKQSGEDSE